jgi:hypothetical protein
MISTGNLFAGIPESLVAPLLEEYRGICAAFSQGRWKLASLDAGRFCEVVFTILKGYLSGAFASSPSKPSDFVSACRALENQNPAQVGDRSLRILIPRLLPALYEIRNNRNVGHVGGDVVSNKMDATFVRESAAWILAELIRIAHQVSTEEAQQAVDALTERVHPLIWEVDGIRRVLSPGLTANDKALLLLYSTSGWVSSSNLKEWVRYTGDFNRVLKKLFDKQLVEVANGKVIITPLGVKEVEFRLITEN